MSSPNPAASAQPTCPVCQGPVAADVAYCPTCGSRVGARRTGQSCPKCSAVTTPNAKFCASCGYGLSEGARSRERTSAFVIPATSLLVTLVQVNETGQEISRHDLASDEVAIGRADADVLFEDDEHLSPRHAELNARHGKLFLRDLGSRNGTWFFLEEPYRLRDGDRMLIGSQILLFKRLGYPGPNPPEADNTRRLGSLTPAADIATLTQLRSDGSHRDVIHLSPGRNVTLGRDQGDWLFSYDPSMSGLHAQIRSEDADFILVDAGSRNGVAVAVRGERELVNGSRFLIGNKMLRIEMP